MTKIAMVSYHNTFPFLNGIRNSKYLQEHSELHLVNPAECARMFRDGEVDISLLPVGALPDLSNFEIVTDFCIGCDGKVRTVYLMSNVPIRKTSSLYLDSHSRTSAVLSRLVIHNYFEMIDTEIQTFDATNFELDSSASYLMIGDKVFEHEGKFKYHYDLGEIWKEMTGLPFTFAVWVARPEVKKGMLQELNIALMDGYETLSKEVKIHYPNDSMMKDYLENKISYPFDKGKQMALKLFLERGFGTSVQLP